MKSLNAFMLITSFLVVTNITNAQYSGGNGRGDTAVLKINSYLGNNWLTTGTTNFNDATNWSNGNFPINETALIPSGGTQPIINATSGNATITTNTTINLLSGALLTINNGFNLTFNGGASVIVDGTITNNGTIILKSDASSTASVGTSSGSISGNVTVERYLPAKRTWRFLTAPLTNSTNNTIFYNWQNNDVISFTNGVELWSPTGDINPSNANSGMLSGGASANIKQYINNAWSLLTNTNGQSGQPTLFNASTNNAFCVFVTAPYNSANTNIYASAVATTLSATGNLIMGTHVKNLGTATSGQFFLVGNPYASPINPASITSTNLSNNYFMWDPTLNGTYNAGQYITYNTISNQYSVVTGAYSNSPLNSIQSGQSFFVQASSAAATSISFQESAKNLNVTNGIFRSTSTGIVQTMRNTLKRKIGGIMTNLDGAVGVFYEGGNAAIDANDAPKLSNSSENIALRRANLSYVFEERPLLNVVDTLFLRIWNTQQSEYTLELVGNNLTTTPGLTAELKDKYTNASIPLSLADTNNYSFAVDGNAASSGDRFMVVFKANTTLPVQFTNVKAYQKGTTVQVDWKVATEQNMKHYVVEKSTDAVNFTSIATQTANNIDNSSYSAIDNTPNNGSNYYRVLSIANDGSKAYSNVALVKIGGKQSSISVYPNPVVGNTMNLQMQNVAKGDYAVQMINESGRVVYQINIQQAGGSGAQSIKLPSAMSSGNYVMKVVDEKGVVFTQKVLVGGK
jgi:hypothetical protein